MARVAGTYVKDMTGDNGTRWTNTVRITHAGTKDYNVTVDAGGFSLIHTTYGRAATADVVAFLNDNGYKVQR